MVYPCLVPARLCKTPIKVYLESEKIDNLGNPSYVENIELLCNYQDKVHVVLTSEKKLVQATGKAMFPGDIAPAAPSLSSGYVEVLGQQRRIIAGTKNRNPDGTVNFCTLEVM